MSSAFQTSLSNGVPYSQELTPAQQAGVLCGPLRSREWGLSRHGPIGYPFGLGEALAGAKAAGRKGFLICCMEEGRIKQKVAPKDLFRILADRISFCDAAAIYQYFEIGNSYFIFAVNI